MNDEELRKSLPRLRDTRRGLREFQRRTADYVFDRMYLADPPSKRFLVADEVGLGKTKVAQGVIARAIEHLHDRIPRLDIVYICSNAAIARQNLQRLSPLPDLDDRPATRLTLLPLQVHELRRSRVNLVSFTPGTAIDTSGGGIWQERVLLHWLLADGFGDKVAPTRTALRNLMQYGVGARWDDLLKDNRPEPIEPTAEWDGSSWPPRYDTVLAGEFCASVRGDRALWKDLQSALESFSRYRENIPDADGSLRYQVIGALRQKLARVCVQALEPDLVILDEFQRFDDLLTGDSEAAELAKLLFDFVDADGNEVRTLLLSATPYRMLTLAGEGEDHHAGFVQTFKFLAQGDDAALDGLRAEIDAHRRALTATDEHGPNPEDTAAALRDRLLRVMCRTERVGLTHKRDAMLREQTIAAPLTRRGIRAGVMLDTVAAELGAGNPIEYWKSAPFPLSFMRGYELKDRLHAAATKPSEGLLTTLHEGRDLLLRKKQVRQWEPLADDHGRFASLADETIGRGLWKLLWLPPSLPYIEPSGAFAETPAATKALVFSAWSVVPDAIAGLLSYEAERRMVEAEGREETPNYDAFREQRRALLSFRIDREKGDERAGSMMTLALLYPSVTLAETVDPLAIALTTGDGAPVSLEGMRASIRERFKRLVEREVERFGDTRRPIDRAWYWALPALLDRSRPRLIDWLDKAPTVIDQSRELMLQDDEELRVRRFVQLFQDESKDSKGARDEGFEVHVRRLHALMAAARAWKEGDAPLLGAPPKDLLEVLADLALASPAVCSLRAFLRVVRGELESDHWVILHGAAKIARGFRTLFSAPETTALLSASEDEDDGRSPYWRRVLEYCTEGNLQAVLDEYVQIKIDDTGTRDKAPAKQVAEVSNGIAEALAPNPSRVTFEEIDAKPRAGRIDIDEMSLRCRFAMRYGDLRNAQDSATIYAGTIKSAFNSPFRPFVLATTSIGQEGLDFHHYCHAVYHWNLPSNPVDLEQREGRVHRFKGHAVRRNVALAGGLCGLRDHWRDGEEDPWECLFRLARHPDASSEIAPYWVFETEGGVSVERRVPMLPLSREHAELVELKRGLATYRLVFGQPRQEDLLAFLARRGIADDPERLARWRIDLHPPRVGEVVPEVPAAAG